MRTFTIVWQGQEPLTLTVDTVAGLARVLYELTSWGSGDCRHVAQQAFNGFVYNAPDYETFVLPGRWPVMQGRPFERLDGAA